MTRFFHITSAEDWSKALAAGEYRLSTRGKTLDEVGFVHCSYANQVTQIADALYRGVHGLVLLVIDPERIEATVRVENLDGGTENFPHVYGPLNLEAVVAVLPFEPLADGSFVLPAELRS